MTDAKLISEMTTTERKACEAYVAKLHENMGHTSMKAVASVRLAVKARAGCTG